LNKPFRDCPVALQLQHEQARVLVAALACPLEFSVLLGMQANVPIVTQLQLGLHHIHMPPHARLHERGPLLPVHVHRPGIVQCQQ